MTTAQREATLRWLEKKPEARERQLTLGRLRAARQRERKSAAKQQRGTDPGLTLHSSLSPSLSIPPNAQPNSHLSPQHVANLATRTSHSSSVAAIRAEIQDWTLEWGSEKDWAVEFHRELRRAEAHPPDGVDSWVNFLDDHVRHGRDILVALKNVNMKEVFEDPLVVQDIFTQVLELTHHVLSEVVFISVKLDEYAPALPSSRISGARHFTM
ncbi:hypothetical protein CONPUDRAFT_75784 [Coniophora puteana RWD-64-598 SS2]|uniref:Uncharacterized protein n=1 Tax=Coniophora puteana (strain RWD-64-598) TaxID=741705 RepID=A0A5M3MFL1_CONPW|nr:uncharacterized protein CONPUDRAFT_75784 [Coniophora puteana RWD-64-598 SS2]EIW78049.1 hypothetical protein CONPUDRAFT_75784 [Coniophora puteana RWD-64-598 SS2]